MEGAWKAKNLPMKPVGGANKKTDKVKAKEGKTKEGKDTKMV